MIRRSLRLVQTQLDDRNSSIRKHLGQDRPSTVIKPPLVINAYISALNNFLRQLCQGRRAGSRVLLLKKLPRKSAEVMNRWWTLHPRNQRSSCFPMCRDTQDRIRFGQDMAHISPGAAVLIIFDSIHRAAMSNKER